MPIPVVRAAFAGCLMLAASASLALPAGTGPIRPEALRAHIRFLADDRLEGRGTATRGYELAASYVAAQFEALGLEPAGDPEGYLQAVPFARGRTVSAECRLQLVRGSRIETLRYAEDYVMPADLLRDRTELDAGVVFAGHGVTAPELHHDDYAGLEVRGKWVVLLSGAPSGFPNDQRAHYSNSLNKSRNAAAHGAAGILNVRTPADEERATWERVLRQGRLPSMQWCDPQGRANAAVPELRVSATLHRPAAGRLFAGSKRSLEEVFAEPGAKGVQGFELACRVRARRATTRDRASSPNVAALLRGSDPRLRDEVVVLTAHLDHLGISTPVRGDSINNGAYDNASGVAMLLEVARAMSARARPRRSVLFLATTGEEKGLQGADYFATHPTVPSERIVANINMDMTLLLHPLRSVVAFGAEHSTLGPVVEQQARSLGLRLAPDPDPQEVIFVRSDQYPFVRQGIPALFPSEGPSPDSLERASDRRWMRTVYHSPQDDLGQAFDYDSGARFAWLCLKVAERVANDAARPHWNPGDFFGDTFGRAPLTRGSAPPADPGRGAAEHR